MLVRYDIWTTMTTGNLILFPARWNVKSKISAKIESPVTKSLADIVTETAKELRETQSTKAQALAMMREWICKNMDIRNIRQDEPFLLRFLRHKKYSVPMAQQTLLKYLSLRKYYPEIFRNIDCEEQRLQEIINDGYILVSPVRDNKGRRVIIYTISRFNAQKYICWDICRAHALVYESLLDDPTDQVCGYTHIGDGCGVTGAHIASWNPTDFARIIKWGEQSFPMRHKEFHLINVPSSLKYILDFAVSKATPKMAGRLHLYSNLNQLHAQINTACLPTHYGGEIKFEDMVSYTKQLISEYRKKILSLDDMEILSTRGIQSSKNRNQTNGDVISIEGSFRKLDID